MDCSIFDPNTVVLQPRYGDVAATGDFAISNDKNTPFSFLLPTLSQPT
jgi:mRNA degradation ribonuclease J1/J2